MIRGRHPNKQPDNSKKRKKDKGNAAKKEVSCNGKTQ